VKGLENRFRGKKTNVERKRRLFWKKITMLALSGDHKVEKNRASEGIGML